jgi:drug/metabolite transporter (DMT)-like permease
MLITLSLLGIAFAITGLMAFAFFWPMTLVHLRDRYPDLHAQLGGAGAIAISTLLWLLAGRYRESHDPALDGLGTPARLALFVLLLGLASAGGFGLIAWAMKP